MLHDPTWVVFWRECCSTHATTTIANVHSLQACNGLSRFLLPANELWGKVMFLQVSVILSMGGGVLYDVTSCLAAWSHVPSRGSLSLVTCSFMGGFIVSDLWGGKSHCSPCILLLHVNQTTRRSILRHWKQEFIRLVGPTTLLHWY